MICLDTAFIIDLLKNRKGAVNKFSELKNVDLATTSISLYEIKAGIYRKYDASLIQSELIQFNDFLESMHILNINNASIQLSAEINGELTKTGSIIGDFDILIAGICLSNGCSRIVTKNVKHFSKIKGLKVETY